MKGILLHSPYGSEWLTFYDPDGGPADVSYPTGLIDSDEDPATALRFESMQEAMEFARRASTRTPLRPDGLPNRPLTAITMTIMDLPEKEEA